MAKTITLYTPHPKQLEVHESPARFKVANFSRRAGKSTMAQNYILHPAPLGQGPEWPIQGALQKVGRYWIVAPTYAQAKSVYWRGLMFSKDPGDTTAIPKELIKEVNNSDLIITLINGSTIELKGADNPDSLRGAEANGIVLDEFAFWEHPEAWEFVLQPMLSTTKGWALFISTPNGYNHFFDMAEYAKNHKDWSYHKGNIYDNPNIDDEEKERLKEDLDEDTFAQEYMAEFRKMKGLVYPEFSRDTHVFDPRDPDSMEKIFGSRSMPVGGTYGLGIDPGTRKAFAAVFAFIDFDDNWYIIDEIYERDMDTERLVNAIKRKMGPFHYSIKVADQAAAQFITDANAIHHLGVYGQKKTRDAIPEGIRLIRQMMKVQEGTGRPKFFVANTCTNWIKEAEMYHYDERNENKEDPVKENDHLMDATRYLKLAVFTPMSRPPAKRKRLYDSVTGRRIGMED